LLATNLLAPMRLTQACCPGSRPADRRPSSTSAPPSAACRFAGFAAYSSAKAGLRGFSQACAANWPTRVDVIHLAPRAIDTPLNTAGGQRAQPRPGQPQRHPGSRSEADRRRLSAAATGEHHFGFPENLFAWLNGVARLIDQGLAGKLATIKKHALNPVRNERKDSVHETAPNLIRFSFSCCLAGPLPAPPRRKN
jgi:NAD(P)-dependent dehydrogenase (short-subunit alcohol dehydrogenase family)